MAKLSTLYDISNSIAVIEDYPKKGIMFRDISGLLANNELFFEACNYMAQLVKDIKIDYIACLDARGFLFTPLAKELNCKIVMIRKAGKLPTKTITIDYGLEYGTNTLAVNIDAFTEGSNVLIVDDLLATGGSACASATLIEKCKCNVVGILTLIELLGLDNVKDLKKYKTFSLLKYQYNDNTTDLLYSTICENTKIYTKLQHADMLDSNVVKVFVASESMHKLSAVYNAFTKKINGPLIVHGIDVESGVSVQPFGKEETTLGCN